MTKLIVNADDFGYSKGVNYGIIEAFQYGVVTSTTLMANMPEVVHAAKLTKENQTLSVGLHFVLDHGRPLADHVPSLVDENGFFRKGMMAVRTASQADIEKELMTQYEMLCSLGLTPSHLDSHHHVHILENVYPVVERFVLEHKLPLRRTSNLSINPHLQSVDYFSHRFYGESLTVSSFIQELEMIKHYQTAELMTHPAYLDQSILDGSSYALARAKELEILTASEVKQAVREFGIELTNYRIFNS